MSAPTEMDLRVASAQLALDDHHGKRLRLSHNDCIRMFAAHCRRMGYPVRLPPAGSYSSVEAAKKALAARGFASLEAAVDSMGFERIPPAAAVAGDGLLLPGADELGALAIALGNGRAAAFHLDAPKGGVAALQPLEIITAWRIPPKVTAK